MITFGPLVIHTYGLFVVLGIIIAVYVALRNGRASGVHPPMIAEMGALMVVAGFLGARLAYVIMDSPYYISNPREILKVWYGGLVFSGGILFAVPALIWYLRRHHLSFWKAADLWAPSLAVGEAIGRIGCFMAGCCYGKPTGLKWGVVFSNPDSLAPSNIPLHPTQIYSFLAGMMIFFVLMVLRRKKRYEGQVFLWFLILHSIFRLLIERFRADLTGPLPGTDMSATQLFTLLILAAAVTGLLLRKPAPQKKAKQ